MKKENKYTDTLKELRRKVMDKHSLAKIINEANTFSNDVMEMAVQEGILPSFERLASMQHDYNFFDPNEKEE